jgi:hypothetical protein
MERESKHAGKWFRFSMGGRGCTGYLIPPFEKSLRESDSPDSLPMDEQPGTMEGDGKVLSWQ